MGEQPFRWNVARREQLGRLIQAERGRVRRVFGQASQAPGVATETPAELATQGLL